MTKDILDVKLPQYLCTIVYRRNLRIPFKAVHSVAQKRIRLCKLNLTFLNLGNTNGKVKYAHQACKAFLQVYRELN